MSGAISPDHPRRCTATVKRTGEQCRLAAMRGGTVCGSHGGRAPQVRAAARRRLTLEELRSGDLHDILLELEEEAGDRSPIDLLASALQHAAGMVEVLRLMTGGLEVRPGSSKAGAEPANSNRIHGPNHLGDGAQHVVIAMYGEWLDRLGKLSKAAIEVGLDARRVEIAERDARRIAQVLLGAAEDIRVSYRTRGVEIPDAIEAEVLRDLPGILARHLGAAATPDHETFRAHSSQEIRRP